MGDFTPGPWLLARFTCGVDGDHGIGLEIDGAYAPFTEADEALIEVVPELVAAAGAALEYLQSSIGLTCEDGCDCLIHDLESALVAARGEAVSA